MDSRINSRIKVSHKHPRGGLSQRGGITAVLLIARLNFPRSLAPSSALHKHLAPQWPTRYLTGPLCLRSVRRLRDCTWREGVRQEPRQRRPDPRSGRRTLNGVFWRSDQKQPCGRLAHANFVVHSFKTAPNCWADMTRVASLRGGGGRWRSHFFWPNNNGLTHSTCPGSFSS